MTNIDVVIPTKYIQDVASLVKDFNRILPNAQVHVISEGHNWPTAINIGLKKCTGDVILCDDDIELRDDTFYGLEDYYDEADIFGYKLLYPNGTIQFAGGYYVGHYGHRQPGDTHNKKRYCDHITTSLCFIKKHVLDEVGEMATDYPGEQFEDVDFMIRAGEKGFNKLYIPQVAIHHESATKKQTIPDFINKMNINHAELYRRHNL